MKRTWRAILGVFFLGVMMFSAISICQNVGRTWRADLTEKKIYTLSAGTRAILGRLSQPIKLKLFYAKTGALKGPDQIKFFNNYYYFVRSLLEEYERAAGGKVKLEVIDPRPFSDEEQEALRYGLRALSITEEENFFFGLVVETEYGATKSVPFFAPERQSFVEYDISYLIDTAMARQKRRIGVMSSLPVLGDDVSGYMARMMMAQGQRPRPAWMVINQLRQQYEVTSVGTEVEAIPAEVDLLLVIHPKDLSEGAQWAIDQFILKGGRAIVCVDPFAVADMPSPQQRMMGGGSESSNLPRLLRAWGLEMPANVFAGDRSLAVPASVRPNERPQPIIGYLGLSRGCFNEDEAITADLNMVRVLFAGVLRESAWGRGPAEPNGAAPRPRLTPLLSTTAAGNAFQAESFEISMMDPPLLMSRFTEGSRPVHLGYLVSGAMSSAFPGGVEVEVEAPADPNAPREAEGKAAARKVKKRLTGLSRGEDGAAAVFSDVDFLSDLVAFRNTVFGPAIVGDNYGLLLNAIEALSGSGDLISIRSRGSYQRPFSRIDRIEAEAEKETAALVGGLQAKIRGLEGELSNLKRPSSQEEQGLIESAVIDKIRKIEVDKRQAQQELVKVNRQRRGEIDRVENRLRNFNLLVAPGVILLAAVLLAVRRSVHRRLWVRRLRED